MSAPRAGGTVEAVIPLSPLQEGMLFHALSDPERGIYLEQVSLLLRIPGGLDSGRLRAALAAAILRHPALRSGFTWKQGKRPLQVVTRRVIPEWIDVDLCALSPPERWREASRLGIEERRRPFNFSRPPLIRTRILRVADDEYLCRLVYHHMVMDGWSLALVMDDLLSGYAAPNEPRSPVRPFADYIRWLEVQDRSALERHWRRALAGLAAPTPLGIDRVSPRVARPGYERRSASAGAAETARLQLGARRFGVTLATLCQAAWALQLHRYSGEPEVLYGVTLSGRPRELAGAESIVGLFINTLPLRIATPDRESLGSWLPRLQNANLELATVQHSSLVEIQGWSEIPRTQPLFDSIFVFENTPASRATAGAPIEILDSSHEAESNYPLSLVVLPGDHLTVRLLCRTERLDKPMIARTVMHWFRAASAIAAAPDHAGIGDLDLLSDPERQQLVHEWNDTARPRRPGGRLHHPFRDQARARPDAIALATAEETLSYRALDRRAGRIASWLVQEGLGAGEPVAVCLPRSVDMVATVLGVLAAGGCYVPVEPAQPAPRTRRILAHLGVRFLVSLDFLVERLAPFDALPQLGKALCLNAPIGETARLGPVLGALPRDCDAPPVATETPDEAPAYVIFTSGSTGLPKGVEVRHAAALNLIEWVNERFAVGRSERLLCVASLAFDLSVYDLFGIFAAGGTVRLADEEELAEPACLTEILLREQITFWDSAPAALDRLAPLFDAPSPKAPPPLRLVFLSGDWIPLPLPARVIEAFPRAQVIALGGATEAAIWSNSFPVGEILPEWDSVPYGRPIENAHYRVLDDRLEPCPIGVAGDLFIGDRCLASGYAREPALTAWKFVPDPFSQEPGAVLYRTGDRARTFPDGTIEFLGRVDQQVKIRGFRIELGEVEATLAAHPRVGTAVAIVREDHPGMRRLVAYVVPREPHPIDVKELQAFVADRLPEPLVPSAIVPMASFPLTGNGKLDRNALPPPEGARTPPPGLPPRSPLELEIARIWEELLGISSPGVRADFFELGGHSLLVVRLLGQLRARFGCELPLRSLLEASTIERLALQVAAAAPPRPWNPLVRLAAGGSLPPLFCVHPGGGSALDYAHLARECAPNRPVYAFQARGLEPGEQPFDDVGTLAEVYCESLREIEPEGPLLLLGWSFGGLVAQEMARRLEPREVRLILVDTPAALEEEISDEMLLADLAQDLGLGSSVGEEGADLKARLGQIVDAAGRAALLPPGFGTADALRLFAVHRHHLDAACRHRPLVWSGRALLFVTDGMRHPDSPDLGWSPYVTGGLDLAELPGRHGAALSPESSRLIARRIAEVEATGHAP